MFERNILQDLEIWDKEKDRKPLIIRGARQVGKTTAIDIFARKFDHYLYMDLEKPEYANIFERGLQFDDLLQAIYLTKKLPYSRGKTLLFLDEIQACPAALPAIRNFYESAKELRVIAAGSLLDVMIGKNQISFPVGRVRYLFMYPLTFEEYLRSQGEETLLELLRTKPLPEFALENMFTLFHQFTLIGGMPEIVKHWSEHRDIVALTPIYQGLLTSFQDDVSKYARNSTMVETIRLAMEAAPLEAGGRIKFAGFGKSNYRTREMGEALRTLERAMLIHLLYPTTHIKPPLQVDKKKSPKLLFLDTGLMNYAAGIQSQYFEYKNLNDIYRGVVMEHIVGQEMLAGNNHAPAKPVFWVREKKQSTAEVDFVIPYGEKLIPIEVKSGVTGRLRSLHEFMDRVDHHYAIRIFGGKLDISTPSTPRGKTFKLLNLPYCLTGVLDDYIEWFIHSH